MTFNAAGLSGRTIGEARRIASDNGAAGMPDIRAYHVCGELLSAIQDGGDRMFGALLGALVTGNPAGSAVGIGVANVPEAYGERVPLDPVRPVGTPWWRDSPGVRHGMDYVLSSLGAR